jgi:hypothetical protein
MKMHSKSFSLKVLGLITLVCSFLCPAQQLQVSSDHTNGVYEVGESVRWLIEWKVEALAPAAHYKLLRDGLTEIGQGDLNFTNQAAVLIEKFLAPGTMLLEVKWRPEEGQEKRAVGGAVAAPERIPLSASRPQDFDAFGS